MGDFLEEAEQDQIFRKKSNINHELIFATKGSTGSNPQKLAQICCTFDLVISLLGWENKPLANLSKFLTQYQASIDAHYHNDYKEILVAEEIEKRRAERKGISVMTQ